ncbi:hypothetical protein V7182_22405 [Neobacillus drentensis]|uniref:hypothetical protein n=1 Tax=Neobacillus drentensis TaxID=220684 RepID=UPI002FFDCB2C
MNYRECALIISGCIQPSANVPVLVLKDHNERRKQYINSIRYYLENTPFKNIIYCDNSKAQGETSLGKLAESYGKRFEWLSFEGDNEACVQKGKGYGEGEIIDYVFRNSEILKNCKYIVKVTGRIIISNIGFLSRIANMGKIYFQPNATIDGRLYINTRIYMMPKNVYQKWFHHAYQLVDDKNGVYLEHAFGKQVDKNNIIFNRFLVCPIYEGISGSTGGNYHTSFKENIKNTIKMYMVKRR